MIPTHGRISPRGPQVVSVGFHFPISVRYKIRQHLMNEGFMWAVAYLNVKPESVTDGCIHHCSIIIQNTSSNYQEKWVKSSRTWWVDSFDMGGGFFFRWSIWSLVFGSPPCDKPQQQWSQSRSYINIMWAKPRAGMAKVEFTSGPRKLTHDPTVEEYLIRTCLYVWGLLTLYISRWHVGADGN